MSNNWLRFVQSENDTRLVILTALISAAIAVDLFFRVLKPPLPTGPEELAEAIKPLSVKRPTASLVESLFQDDEKLEPDTNPTQAVSEELQEGVVTSLFVDQKEYQLHGCFIEAGKRSAAALKQGQAPLKVLNLFDPIGPYRVISIKQTSVTLRTESGREISLRMYSPNRSQLQDPPK